MTRSCPLEKSFCSWLSVICLNSYRKLYNDAMKFDTCSLDAPVLTKDGELCGTLADTIDSGVDVEKRIIDIEMLKEVLDWFFGLRSNYRRAMELCYIGGMSRKEASVVLNVRETTLNNHLKRGADRLAKYLREREDM